MITDSSMLTIPPVDFDLVAIPNLSVQRAYRVVAVPVVMVVSSDGKIEWVHYGALTSNQTSELLSVIESRPTNRSE
jgi:predicted transcriptional regulator